MPRSTRRAGDLPPLQFSVRLHSRTRDCLVLRHVMSPIPWRHIQESKQRRMEPLRRQLWLSHQRKGKRNGLKAIHLSEKERKKRTMLRRAIKWRFSPPLSPVSVSSLVQALLAKNNEYPENDSDQHRNSSLSMSAVPLSIALVRGSVFSGP